MYITRLSARNWKNFTEIDVSLRDIVYLVGPNASGKSNFLDIFRFLRDIVNPKGGGLQKAVSDRGGLKKIRCLAARKYPDVEIRVELKEDLDDTEPTWEYYLSFQGDQSNKQRVRIVHEEVFHHGRKILARPETDDENDSERMTSTFLEQVNANKDFRDVSGCFDDVLYLHLVPQLLKFGNQLAVQRMESDPFGQGFLDMVASTVTRTRDSRLKRINTILKSVIPQFKELQFERDKITGTPHLKMLYQHWRDNGAWQSEDQFSDGTLRLISLLWTLMSSKKLILLEEPELSLHGPIVEQIPTLFYEALVSRKKTIGQIIVSTHSERLLSDKSLDAGSFLLIRPGKIGETSRIEPLDEDDIEAISAGKSPAEIVFAKTESSVKRLA